MNNEPSGSKAKIIASIAVIAVIALIYFITPALADKKATGTASSKAPSQSQPANTNPTPAASNSTASGYKDGTYSAAGSYRTPQTVETINVTLTIKNGVVTDSSIQQTAQQQESAQYQADFKNNYQPLVVGKKLSDIHLSRVSGSSLTSGGFNAALDQIKSQANA